MSNRNESPRESGTRAGAAAGKRTAPAPDDRRKPDTPTELRPASWKYALRRCPREFLRHQCLDLAAALTYFGMLSIFPALLALVSLLGVFGQAETTTRSIMQVLESVASPEVVSVLRQPVEQLAAAPTAGLALAAGLLGALWSASGYVGAFGRSMNRIYEVPEGRPALKLKPLMMLLTLVLLLMVAAMAILLLVSGPLARTLGDAVGLGEGALAAWNIAKWPLLLLFAVLVVAVLYYATPNIRQPRFRWLSPGSVIALAVLAVATVGFFFYVSNFANYNRTYGTIGGVIVMMLWLWIANLSLLFGAVFDAETERSRELQGGIEAERTVRLPPRDTAASDKARERRETEIRRGRELRREAGNGHEGEGRTEHEVNTQGKPHA